MWCWCFPSTFQRSLHHLKAPVVLISLPCMTPVLIFKITRGGGQAEPSKLLQLYLPNVVGQTSGLVFLLSLAAAVISQCLTAGASVSGFQLCREVTAAGIMMCEEWSNVTMELQECCRLFASPQCALPHRVFATNLGCVCVCVCVCYCVWLL